MSTHSRGDRYHFPQPGRAGRAHPRRARRAGQRDHGRGHDRPGGWGASARARGPDGWQLTQGLVGRDPSCTAPVSLGAIGSGILPFAFDRAFRTMLGSSDMPAYMAMMAPAWSNFTGRSSRRGSLWLHCDPTASHYHNLLIGRRLGIPLPSIGERLDLSRRLLAVLLEQDVVVRIGVERWVKVDESTDASGTCRRSTSRLSP